VPPLHERKEDLPKLAEHILSALRISGTTKRTISPEAVQALTTHSWTGNVRELRNVLEGIVLMSQGAGPISREEVLALLPKTRGSSQSRDHTRLSLEEIERLHIERVLTASGGNKTQAAKTLDIDYKTLLTKLKKYGLAT
jgi:transcriptional regulator with PAS, ATPase and Fis domain